MSAVPASVVIDAAAPESWSWPIDSARYNRRPELTNLESQALRRLGMNVRRRRGYARDAPEWRTVKRLLQPLDDARTALWCPDTPHHRRAITDAIGLVLLRCAENDTSFWGWSDQDWVSLIGTSVAEFERPWPGMIDGTIRPYVTSYAYVIGGFTAFQLIGNFDKLPVAWRVFGRSTVDDAILRIGEVLGTWGYRIGRAHDDRLPTVICQALLLNHSPRLEDLTTDAFERLRQHPAMVRWHIGTLHGIQRAVAALGFCEAPSNSIHGSMPAIEGTDQQWAAWVERWFATSTLTPKVRGIFRGAIAKAGRWLADQHPEVVEPESVDSADLRGLGRHDRSHERR